MLNLAMEVLSAPAEVAAGNRFSFGAMRRKVSGLPEATEHDPGGFKVGSAPWLRQKFRRGFDQRRGPRIPLPLHTGYRLHSGE
jgi:hypothetical protein